MHCGLNEKQEILVGQIVHLLSEKQLENKRYYIKAIAEVIQFLVVNEILLHGHNYPDNDEQGIFEKLLQFTIKKITN